MVGALADVVLTAAFVLALWVACLGVGRQILPKPPAKAEDGTPATGVASWNQPGLAAVVGLSTLIALGGIGAALHLPLWLTAGPFVLLGLALTVTAVVRAPWRPGPWPASVVVGLGAVGLVVVALVESRIGGTFRINGCDELRAYLPMAKRLLATNAINEPWSYRRLQNLGGFTYLQAGSIRLFGDVGIAFVETAVASVFLAGFFVWTGFRSLWPRIAAVAFIFAIPLFYIPRVNVAPVLAAVPLLIGIFAVTIELRAAMRGAEHRNTVRFAIAGGLLLAAVASVRAPILPLAVLCLGLGPLFASGVVVRDRIRAVAIAAGAAVGAVFSWLVASWEAVGTPLYPLLRGNANAEVPAERDPNAFKTLGSAIHHIFRFLNTGSYSWVVVAVLLVVLLAWKVLPDRWMLVIITTATIACILSFTFTLSIASPRDFGRYISPMAISLAVFLLYELVRGIDARAVDEDRRARWAGVVALGFAVVCMVAVVTTGSIGVNKDLLHAGGLELLTWAPDRVPNAVYSDHITPAGLEAKMRVALKRVDPDHTILAVDRPYIIDYKKHDLPNMDLPGWAAPDGKFPFFNGTPAKLAVLRKQGYNYLIATVPAGDRCLATNFLRFEVANSGPPDSIYAKYFLDWTDGLDQIRHVAPDSVSQIGNLLVFDLRRAQAGLRAPGAR